MSLQKFVGFVGLMLAVVLVAGQGLAPARAQPSSERLVTVLSSSSRTATTTSNDIVNTGPNLNARGAYITLDVTGILTTPLITLTVQAKDPVSSKYEAVWTTATGVSATGTHTYLMYPGAGAAADDVTEIKSYPLPAQWRVSVAHGDTDPITYTVGAQLLP